MKKMLFLLVLLPSIFMSQSSSAQSISAHLVDTMTYKWIGTNDYAGNPTNVYYLYGSLSIDYTATPAGYYFGYTGWVYNGKYHPPYWDPGPYVLFNTGSYGETIYVPVNQSPEDYIQSNIYGAEAGDWQLCLTKPDYTMGCSNVVHIAASSDVSSNAPIGSPTNSLPIYGPFGPSILTDSYTYSPDPVNIATGEDYFFSTDISLKGQEAMLALSRRYRSFATINGIFGYGWRTNFDVNLTVDTLGNVIVYDGNGTGSYFMNHSGTYTNSPGNYSTIKQNPDSTYTITDKHGIVTHYAINGRLLTRTDRNGNALTFVYNPAQVGGTYIQDATGRKITLNIGSNGHVISAVDPAGKTFQYGYDVNGNLVSVIDPTGAVTNYTYNGNHAIIQFTNSNGHNTYYQYDSQGRCVMNWRDSNVNKTTLNYQANNTTVVTDSLGNSNTYVFNNDALLTSLTDPLGKVTQQRWDSNMDLLLRLDANGNMTAYSYDGQGNLISVTDPSGSGTALTYTPDFNLINSKIDAMGNVTHFSYDNDGNLMSATDALGSVHALVNDQFGNVITATDSRGNSTNFAYDALGHLIQKTDALGKSTHFSYQ